MIVDPKIEEYLRKLYDDGDPVRREMEELARKKSFPIVGPLVGRHLEVLTRAIGARRIFELGSGYGYSALHFSRAAGPGATIHCTDISEENERLWALRQPPLDFGPGLFFHAPESGYPTRRSWRRFIADVSTIVTGR